MLAMILGLGSCSLAAAPPPRDLAAVLRTYDEAREKVGKAPSAHIKLALWCEAHGLDAERVKHLTKAILADPRNATARGLLGLADYRGSWQRPEAVTEKVKADGDLAVKLAEYNKRRSEIKDTADEHWQLARWCEEQGLEAEAMAHFTAVVRRDPGRDAAWVHLGCKKHDGRWVTEAQLAAEREDAEAQKHSDKYWKPLLLKWRGWLGEKPRRAEAEAALATVEDPRAARSVWQVFGRNDEADQRVAVRVLGQIDAPDSSRPLALLATWGASPDLRRLAAETLRRRDPRDYVGFLLSLLRTPYIIRTEYVEKGPLRLPYTSVTTEVGDTTVTAISLTAAINNLPPRFFAADIPFDPFGWNYARSQPGTAGGPMLDPWSAQTLQSMIASPQDAASILSHNTAAVQHPHGSASAGPTPRAPNADQQAAQMVQYWTARARQRDAQILTAGAQSLDPRLTHGFNDLVSRATEADPEIRRANSAIFAGLNLITNQDLPEEREPWRKWYYDAQGYSYTPPKEKPKRAVVLLIPSCFAAGTPVRTLTGLRPIEEIAVGDRVLAQDPGTGKLSFEPVTAVHHNPPGETLNVRVGEEEIRPSIYHRFWRSGRGWAMARDLKPGDEVRVLDGLKSVTAVSPAEIQKVYNLDVARSHSFFVGEVGALVHDNTLPELRFVGFDAGIDRDALAQAKP